MVRRTILAFVMTIMVGILSVPLLHSLTSEAAAAQAATMVALLAPTEPGAPVVLAPVNSIPAAPAPPAAEAPSPAPSDLPTERVLLASRGTDHGGDYQALKGRLTQFLASQEGHYAVYFQDLNTGRSFGINDTETMPAASTIKVPVVLYLYSEAAAGRINLDERVTYTLKDQEGGAGVIYYNHKVGATFTLADLAGKALTLSDNVAVNMLIRRLNIARVNEFCRKLGADTIWNGDNVTSARSMGVYLRATLELAERSTLGRKMLDQMTNTQPTDRIIAGVPTGTKVAHKHGNNHGVINDVGIVFLSGRPYLLSLLAEDVDYFAAPAVLAEISRMVYEYQISR